MGLPKSGGLASKLKVTATYQAYNNTSKQSNPPLPLIYEGDLIMQRKRGAASGYVPYYFFGKTDDASYEKGYDKWVAQRSKGAKGKDSLVQALTVGHFVDGTEVESYYGIDADGDGTVDFNRFVINLVKYRRDVDTDYYGPVKDYGWTWEEQDNATGEPLGSGLKAAKAKITKPNITWIVKE